MLTPYHLLDFDFLEGTETACTCLHMQRSFHAVHFAFVLVFAIHDGLKRLARNILKGLGTADIARVCIDLQKGFDLRNASNDATNSDETSQMGASNFADGHCYVVSKWFKIQITALLIRGKLGRRWVIRTSDEADGPEIHQMLLLSVHFAPYVGGVLHQLLRHAR